MLQSSLGHDLATKQQQQQLIYNVVFILGVQLCIHSFSYFSPFSFITDC